MTPQEHAQTVKRLRATADRLNDQLHVAREQLAEAQEARIMAIIEDPRRSHAQVGHDFGVSAIWVKKIRQSRRVPERTTQNVT